MTRIPKRVRWPAVTVTKACGCVGRPYFSAYAHNVWAVVTPCGCRPRVFLFTGPDPGHVLAGMLRAYVLGGWRAGK